MTGPPAGDESSSTAAPPALTTSVPIVASGEQCVADRLTLRARLGQLMFPLVNMGDLGAAGFVTAGGEVGGIVLVGSGPPDLAAQIETLRGIAPLGLLVAVDEEGGSVQRLRDLIGSVPSAERLALGDLDTARQTAIDLGRALVGLGIDMDLAPVLDVGGAPGIGSRSFGTDPAVVSAYGAAVIEGLAAGGVIPVVKHFPGHGRVEVDSHDGLAFTPPIDELRAFDLVPFVDLAGGPAAVMVGHLAVPGLTFAPGFTEALPATVSPEAITGLLRGELGFDGLVMTDGLGMRAVSDRWTVPETVELALLAGVDLAMIPEVAEARPTIDALEAAVAAGRIPESRIDEAVVRVLAAKGIDPCRLPTTPD